MYPNPRMLAVPVLALSALFAAPVAAETGDDLTGFDLADAASEPEDTASESAESVPQEERPPQGPVASGPPSGVAPFKFVFDETWATVGIGAGLVPSYSGSDDYIVFPLPLIVGRVAGVGISPNGPGFNLDLLSQGPSLMPPETSFSFGPSFRFRNDRANQIEDEVVELATELDVAIEVGVNGGVSFPGIFAERDSITLNAQVRWDILDAHNGMLFEPGISYFRPFGNSAALQLSVNASFVDDDFADYYYTVTPSDAAATGLAEFTADGGLNSVGSIAILTFDFDGNALNGGLNIYTVAGYTRMVGDAADTPFTAERGSANQFIGGIGLGYTF
ncbi:MipA/OmpV family protein [Erythrobacter sp. KY5]|uniref:MipA/OmpV family protein n=1 Tax=Erythrobacter sp. KY5 TaxID=2011159 RepID=UPI001F46EC92|nr:MipA/OmpV family protein [Erythrobacter sp. KY5]